MAKGKYHEWLTEEGLTLLRAWARDGLTNEQIAHNMGVTVKTLYEWQNRFSEVREALKKGKAVVDYEVENALLRRALGYDYTETRIKRSLDGDEVTTTTKHVPPDVGAQAFWLKNRKPDVWRDRRDEAAEIKGGGVVIMPAVEGEDG